jgi:hypothetical protein
MDLGYWLGGRVPLGRDPRWRVNDAAEAPVSSPSWRGL